MTLVEDKAGVGAPHVPWKASASVAGWPFEVSGTHGATMKLARLLVATPRGDEAVEVRGPDGRLLFTASLFRLAGLTIEDSESHLVFRGWVAHPRTTVAPEAEQPDPAVLRIPDADREGSPPRAERRSLQSRRARAVCGPPTRDPWE
jgi:hypothetical protein